MTPTIPPEPLAHIFEAQHRASRQHMLDHGQRMAALGQLLDAVLAHERALIDALQQDFGRRPAQETRLLEILPVVDEIRHIRRHLRQWMRP